MYASNYNIDTLILPYTQPHGPILFEERGEEEKEEVEDKEKIEKEIRDKIKKNSLSIPGSYIRSLSIIAKNHGIDLLIPGVYERAGPKLYITSVGIPADPGEVFLKTRKTILSDKEVSRGFSPGKLPGIIELSNVRYGLMHDSEILFPEIARYLQVRGADILLYNMHPNHIQPNYSSILKVYSYILHKMIICSGSITYYMDKEIYHMPTTIYEGGEKIMEYRGGETALILIPKNKLLNNTDVNPKILERIHQYIRAIHKHVSTIKAR